MGDAEAARPKQEEKAMNIFTCTSFEGYWPVGAAAVVVAPSIETACQLLADALTERGLPQKITPDQLDALDITQQRAVVLVDGQY
jgi:hypothetical protein